MNSPEASSKRTYAEGTGSPAAVTVPWITVSLVAPAARSLPCSGAPQPLPWQGGPSAGGEAAADLYHSLAARPAELALFLDAMNASSRGVGSAIAAQADAGGIGRLIDLGGGGGQVAAELLQPA